MPFLDVVRRLRDSLDIPAGVPLPFAVKQMSKMMGIRSEMEDGTAVALPDQVEALAEALGVSVELGQCIGDSSDGPDFDFDDNMDDMPPREGSLLKKARCVSPQEGSLCSTSPPCWRD